jgi:DNA polymerase III sliding clamp (beta) subunit (PCNA family)
MAQLNHIIIPTKSTLKTLERVAVYADERSRAVKFSITGGLLTIFASSVETGEAEGKVMGKRGEGATDLEAGYNANYVADFLCATDFQNVAFGWQADTLKADGITVDRRGGTMAAVLTTHDGWQMAIMPMRI